MTAPFDPTIRAIGLAQQVQEFEGCPLFNRLGITQVVLDVNEGAVKLVDAKEPYAIATALRIAGNAISDTCALCIRNTSHHPEADIVTLSLDQAYPAVKINQS